MVTTRQTNIPLGIFLMLCATILFAGSSAAAKWYVATYPFGEVLFVRQTTSFVVFAAVMLPLTGLSVFGTKRLRAHGARAVSQALSQTMIIIAFSLMPLGSAVAISFSSPLFATLASAVVLHEFVGPRRWTALIVGLIGVLVITRPGAETFQVGALFALGNAILYGTVTAGVRGMTATESTATLITYQMVLLTIAYMVYLPFGFVMPSLIDGSGMVVMGLANFVAQYIWTRALHLAPASAVTPFYYFSLVWAMILGYLFWGDVPSAGVFAGSGIVAASGLFLLWHETRGR